MQQKYIASHMVFFIGYVDDLLAHCKALAIVRAWSKVAIYAVLILTYQQQTNESFHFLDVILKLLSNEHYVTEAYKNNNDTALRFKIESILLENCKASVKNKLVSWKKKHSSFWTTIDI